ncbi:innexin inx2-like [Neocloeon triangulifer]|uniref:innexin inx2-like n=1 Tax=Neocloeon triangulifer TaxID=2078957 RepID=UPI00286EF806|nr:innexin inx2-like [Neocloeon triangulifer]
MLNLLGDVTKVYKRHSVTIDNRTFFLNRVVTLGLLTFCFVVQMGTNFFKTSIECIGEKQFLDFANLYCYVHSTYSIKSPDAQLDRHMNVGVEDSTKTQIRHDYYQWVSLALIAQAALTYLPSFVWRIWEGGRIKSLASGLLSPCVTSEVRGLAKGNIKHFLVQGSHLQRFYLARFVFCDLLNLAVIFAQLFFINLLVGNVFTMFGFDALKVLGANPLERTDDLAYVFPTVAKCHLPKFGPSGRQESRDYLCVLPFNLVNEKMYVMLWVWFCILAVVASFSVAFRIMTLFSSTLRNILLQLRCHPGHEHHIKEVVSKFDAADWFILCQIGKNVNTTMFTEIVDELALEMKKTNQLV